MRKWITKKEIDKILRTYSIRKKEFLPAGRKEYFYQSQIVKGYTITISEENEQGINYSEKTGRILVTHTQWNGRKTFMIYGNAKRTAPCNSVFATCGISQLLI